MELQGDCAHSSSSHEAVSSGQLISLPKNVKFANPAPPTATVPDVRQAVPSDLEPPSKTVKVTIHGQLTSDNLEAIFNQFGTITSTPSIIAGKPNYAYINFSSPHEAMAALSLNRQLIRGVHVRVKLKKGSSGALDYRQSYCEMLLVQMFTSSAKPEYKLKIKRIESSFQVKVIPMKNRNGFTISGSEDKLEQAKSELELVISKVREKLCEEPLKLSCHYVPMFANQDVGKQITKIEQMYHVELFVYDYSAEESVRVSIFSHYVSTQLKSHTFTPATIDCVSKFLATDLTTSLEAEHRTGMAEEENVWEWQDDDGNFKAYSAKHCKTFSDNFRDSHSRMFQCTISTSIGVVRYQINFSKMTQTNVLTGNSRKIRQQPTTVKGSVLTHSKQNIVRRLSSSYNTHSMINFHVRGLKDNLEHAITYLRKELQSCVTKVSISLPPDSKGTFHSSLLKLTNSYLVSALVHDDAIHIEGAEGYIDKVVIKVQEVKLSFERKLLAQSPRPDNWDPQDEKIVLKPVAQGTPEWTDIEMLVHASLPFARIQTLQRIQNEWLWEKYSFSKERMNEQNNGVVNEKRLFHGTRSTAPEKIFKSRQQGFDFRLCSRGMWGNGTYFAVSAKYSDAYAFQSHDGSKQFILAKVLTGETYRCEPDSSIKKPPVKKHSEMFGEELYDSVSGYTNGSDIFVIYDHEKAYAEYLITYATTNY